MNMSVICIVYRKKIACAKTFNEEKKDYESDEERERERERKRGGKPPKMNEQTNETDKPKCNRKLNCNQNHDNK